MGEAKRRQAAGVEVGPRTVFHHTSTLRTNLIWMSGLIELEGHCPPVVHPRFGVIATGSNGRRAFQDFPPLAWFTTRREVPKCLQSIVVQVRDEETGALTETWFDARQAAMMSLNRIALEFPISQLPIVPWPAHPGYATEEGERLNQWARDVGDEPNDWYVSEEPVDVMLACAVWGAKSMFHPKLRRWDHYLLDMRRMVLGCRANPKIYIPPSWMSEDKAMTLGHSLGVPVASADNDDTLVVFDQSVLEMHPPRHH